MLESLNRFVAAWLATIRAMILPAVVGPFAALALLQGLVLWFLVAAPSPALGGWPIEVLRAWFGPAAGHYPAHYALMPFMFFRIVIVLYGVIGIVVYGTATGAFAGRIAGTGTGPRGFVGTAVGRYVPMFVIWLVTTAVVLFGISRLPDLFANWAFGSPRREVFIDILTRIMVIAFMSLWAYTTVALIVERASLFGAVTVSVRRCFRRPFATFFLLGLPYLLTVPFSLIATRSEYLVRQFRPETIAIALVLLIISQFVANILTCGSVTHYYLAEPARE